MVFRMLLHYCPAVANGRIDVDMSIGFEAVLFNPFSDQQEVRQAFGHEFVWIGCFDFGFGQNALGGIAFDIARCGSGKLSAFAEWEI